MSDPIARYSFLSWARRGIGARILDPDTLGAAAPARAMRAIVPIAIEVNHTPPIDHAVGLHGPGDVTGLDARAVVRTDPLPNVTDFEPNYLAGIELYDEDLPWRYTPAAAVGHRLRPWIALVVLADGEFERPARRTIRVANAGAVFPPATQVWAWAHVHVNSALAGPAALDAVVAANPDVAVARLLSPRRLRPNTAYTAFVVPTFESGRLAGLGLDLPPDLDGAKPAWGAGQDRFPIYHEWSFRTGAGGDFESLIRLLEPRALDPRIGIRDLDVQTPAPGLLAGIAAPPVLGLEGALRSPDTVSTAWPLPDETFPARLAALINASIASGADPVVVPPFYGQWAAAVPRMGADGNPPWIDELNRDPRHRSAAAFGAEVIRRNQDPLASAAWRQLGAVDAANRLLVIAQLARFTARSIQARHLATLGDDALFAITAPLHARVLASVVGIRATVRQAIRQTVLPAAVLDRGFRRLTRPRGPLVRRLNRTAPPQLIARLGTGKLTAAPAMPDPTHALLLDAVTDRVHAVVVSPPVAAQPIVATHPPVVTQPPVTTHPPVATLPPLAIGPLAVIREGTLTVDAIHKVPARPTFAITAPGVASIPAPGSAGTDSKQAGRFRQALLGLHAGLSAPPAPKPPPVLAVPAVRATLVEALEPGRSIAKRTLARVGAAVDLGARRDPLETLLWAPRFDQPMYAPLAEISSELLLPNVGLIRQNTISLLLTNSRFVESYLVGLNHEMARELLWREYPTDQRGTYFRRFWDIRDTIGGASDDIDAIDQWPRSSALGSHTRIRDDQLVLVIRGDLLKKYPTAVIYAVAAVWPDGTGKRALGTEERYPMFRATIDPDIAFLGFDLDVPTARGSDVRAEHRPGWFFVIKQRPGEPRFGLDETAASTPAASWDDLSWRNVAPGEFIDVAQPLRDVTMPDRARWGTTAAHMASILYQDPVLIAVHASEMLR